MKHLPKHLQPRWRYLALEIDTWPDAELDRRTFQDAVWAAARGLLGDPGSAAAGLTVIEFAHDQGRGEAIVRARRGETDRARAAIACIDRVDGHPVGLRVSGTSGTLQSAREKYLGRRGQPIPESNVVFENDERSATRYPDGVDLRLDGAFTGATDLDLT